MTDHPSAREADRAPALPVEREYSALRATCLDATNARHDCTPEELREAVEALAPTREPAAALTSGRGTESGYERTKRIIYHACAAIAEAARLSPPASLRPYEHIPYELGCRDAAVRIREAHARDCLALAASPVPLPGAPAQTPAHASLIAQSL